MRNSLAIPGSPAGFFHVHQSIMEVAILDLLNHDGSSAGGSNPVW
jgi:hypothetical protein